MLCLMHESDERGVLLLAGNPMPVEALARILNLDEILLNQILSTLIAYGVASRREEDGAIYNRRMVRDEKLIQIRRDAGKRGGNPVLLNQKDKQKPTTPDKQKPTPSSSSSSSSSSSDILPPNPQGGNEEKRVLPSNYKKLTRQQQSRQKVLMNNKLMKRIGKFLNRSEDTLWTIQEAVALQEVNPPLEEVEKMETYYFADIEKEKDFRRKNIATLLNNWNGELDRASLYILENK